MARRLAECQRQRTELQDISVLYLVRREFCFCPLAVDDLRSCLCGELNVPADEVRVRMRLDNVLDLL